MFLFVWNHLTAPEELFFIESAAQRLLMRAGDKMPLADNTKTVLNQILPSQ
jgi:hypothetical protein